MKVVSSNNRLLIVEQNEIIGELTENGLNEFFKNPSSFKKSSVRDHDALELDTGNLHSSGVPVRPSKIICAGRNYDAHIKELNKEVPGEPLLFLKPPSSLTGHGSEIIFPETSQVLHHEVELGVIVGKPGKNIPREDAEKYIAGFTICVDVTARDLQRSDKTWLRGKGYDTFCPVGPYVVCKDELPLESIQDAGITLVVNNELRQNSDTSLMIFKIDVILAYISTIMTLNAGDLILTGTPSGVGKLQRGMKITRIQLAVLLFYLA
ncbi:MAG: fumarylacetoacetate hydrolase family protein [Candidatus Hodarchaeales archaeon]